MRCVFAAIVIVGCTSGPTNGPGILGGPCYANGTCNAPLLCVSGTCDAADATTLDSGAVDAGSACDGAPNLACGQTCFGDASICCAITGQCIAEQDACPSSALAWNCQVPSDCPSVPQQQQCCLLGVFDAGACATSVPTVGGALCQPACDSNRRALCLDDSDCDGGKCVVTQVVAVPARVGTCN